MDVQETLVEIAKILRSRHQTLAISEAACGGLISSYIVSVPGASDFYIGGKLVYSSRQRLKLSGWSDDDVKHFLGPSELVALKFARTTKYELGSTFVLSETGFAGPSANLHLQDNNESDSRNNDNQVGTVYLGLFGPNLQVSVKKQTNSHDRAKNMTEFAKFALMFLLEELQNHNL